MGCAWENTTMIKDHVNATSSLQSFRSRNNSDGKHIFRRTIITDSKSRNYGFGQLSKELRRTIGAILAVAVRKPLQLAASGVTNTQEVEYRS
jgi:hypothetical protein